MKIETLKDFTNPDFKVAFVQYFNEFDIHIDNWDTLFESMSDSNNNELLVIKENNNIVAFLLFRFDQLEHWFLKEHFCFVREFWVMPSYRSNGIGTMLLNHVESLAVNLKIYKMILTTDSAENMYIKNGYIIDNSYIANNNNSVLIKHLQKYRGIIYSSL